MNHGGDCRTAPATPGLLITLIAALIPHLCQVAMTYSVELFLCLLVGMVLGHALLNSGFVLLPSLSYQLWLIKW